MVRPNHNVAPGFEGLLRFFRECERPNYPPYNVVKKSDNEIAIVLALAGFAPDDINIETEEGVLTISGKKTPEEAEYIYRGIAQREFQHKFVLDAFHEVKSAEFKNGLLSIGVERIVPEAKQRKTIPIVAAQKAADPAPEHAVGD